MICIFILQKSFEVWSVLAIFQYSSNFLERYKCYGTVEECSCLYIILKDRQSVKPSLFGSRLRHDSKLQVRNRDLLWPGSQRLFILQFLAASSHNLTSSSFLTLEAPGGAIRHCFTNYSSFKQIDTYNHRKESDDAQLYLQYSAQKSRQTRQRPLNLMCFSD